VRINKSLGVPVVNASVELELERHRKLRAFATSKGESISTLLRAKLVDWIDKLKVPTGEDRTN